MGGGARGRARARGGNQRREVVAARSFHEVQLPEASNFTGDVMPLLGNVSRERFPPNAGRALQRGAACPLRAGVSAEGPPRSPRHPRQAPHPVGSFPPPQPGGFVPPGAAPPPRERGRWGWAVKVTIGRLSGEGWLFGSVVSSAMGLGVFP